MTGNAVKNCRQRRQVLRVPIAAAVSLGPRLPISPPAHATGRDLNPHANEGSPQPKAITC